MNNVSKLIFSLLVAGSLSGCVVIDGEHSWMYDDWQDEQRENREVISELDIGMERSQVVSRLGTPNYTEAFTRDGDEFRVLFFRTQRVRSDGETTRDETTPLIFRNNTLIGWGNDVLASVR